MNRNQKSAHSVLQVP